MWTKKNIPDQAGKTAIVTGANTGIGFETALALYEAGAHVVVAGRDEERVGNAIVEMQNKGGRGSLEAGLIDLSDLASVKQFAERFLKTHTQLHLLINNAGVMMTPPSKTAQGLELQFGTNVIGHFALTGRLYPLLKTTAGARIVTVSSMAYLAGSIGFDNLRSEKSYDSRREYSQSKLGNILFSLELDRRIKAAGDNVLSIAAQPGANKTELAKHMTAEEYQAALDRIGVLMDPWQGALPSLYAGVEADVKGGDFYSPDGGNGYSGYPAKKEIAPNGLDEAAAQKLWAFAEEVTGVQFP